MGSRLFLAALVALALGWIGSAAAAERPDWYPADDVVKAQVAKRQAKRDAAIAYYERELVGEYERAGIHNEAWDDAAHKLIWATIEQCIGNPDAEAMRLAAAQAAGRARIQDPFAYFLYARTRWGNAMPKERIYPVLRQACNGVREADYRGIIRFHALLGYAESKGTKAAGGEGDMEWAEKFLDEALQCLPSITEAKDVPSGEIAAMMEAAQETSIALYGDRWKWTSKLYDAMEKLLPGNADLLAAKARAFTDYAWDARGTGWASTVKEEGWRLMQERLEVAEKCATEAWTKDDQCLLAANTMLQVELGQGKGKPVMETWFKRAVAIDPLGLEAYRRKAYYLEDRWHGTREECLAFGRLVAQTLPREAKARMTLVISHQSMAGMMANGRRSQPDVWERAYFRRYPEAWQEILPIAKDVVAPKGSSFNNRLILARLAYAAGDKQATRLFLEGVTDEQGQCTFGPQYFAEIKKSAE